MFLRLIHAFTCVGMLPSQYYHFCQLASLGTVGKRYTDSGNIWHDINTLSMYIIVYKSKGYIDAIEFCAQASMSHAIDEVKARSEYKTSGEVS